jgi:hypothetical protein
VRVVPQDPFLPEALALVRHVPRRLAQGGARRRLHHVPLGGNRLQGNAPVVRPRKDEVPADRGPREGGLREMPRQRRLPRREVRDLRRLPRGPAPEQARRGLLLVPRDGDLQDGQGRPRKDHFSAPGPARRDPVRRLPQGARHEGEAQGGELRDLPPGPPPGRVQAGLRDLSQREVVQGRALRPRGKDEVPPDGQARRGEMRRVPRSAGNGRCRGGGERERGRHERRPAEGRRLQGAEDRLRRLPQGSARGPPRHGVRHVPRDRELPAEGLQAPPLPGVLHGAPREGRVREVSRRAEDGPERKAGAGRREDLPRPLGGVRELPQGPAPRPAHRLLRDLPRRHRSEIRPGEIRPREVGVPARG